MSIQSAGACGYQICVVYLLACTCSCEGNATDVKKTVRDKRYLTRCEVSTKIKCGFCLSFFVLLIADVLLVSSSCAY